MTKETFDAAKRLEDRIKHIQILIDLLSEPEYRCQPHTRMSSHDLYCHGRHAINLNEGEVVCILEALRLEKKRLEEEFDKLGD